MSKRTRLDIGWLNALDASRKELQEVEEELRKIGVMDEREKAAIEKVMSNPDVRMDDPATQAKLGSANTILSMLPARKRALEARLKVLCKELNEELDRVRRIFANAQADLRKHRERQFVAANLKFFHVGSRPLKRMVREFAPLTDSLEELRHDWAGLTCWSGPGMEGRLSVEVKNFVRDAQKIIEKYGVEIEALGEPQRAEKPPKTRRVRIERMIDNRADDAELKPRINTAPPAMIEGEYYEPGKEYDVDEYTYKALKAMNIAVDLGPVARVLSALKSKD